jgi:splicing factor 3B subunit 3
VIDGDLCEQFPLCSKEVQQKIADSLGSRKPADVLKKLEILRNSIS